MIAALKKKRKRRTNEPKHRHRKLNWQQNWQLSLERVERVGERSSDVVTLGVTQHTNEKKTVCDTKPLVSSH